MGGSLSSLAWSPPYPAEKAQGPACQAAPSWSLAPTQALPDAGVFPHCSASQLSVHTYSSSVMDSWQLSQTLTSNSKPISGMEERLELHFPHTAFPHFRQWCCRRQHAERRLRQQTQARSLLWSTGSTTSLQQVATQLSSVSDTSFLKFHEHTQYFHNPLVKVYNLQPSAARQENTAACFQQTSKPFPIQPEQLQMFIQSLWKKLWFQPNLQKSAVNFFL